MISNAEFRNFGHQFVDWIADYYENIEKYPVKSQVSPGDIFKSLPENPPENSESITEIFKDFQNILIPGVTHWQSPNFFAYFPANSSYPSILAEMLTSSLAAQCMKWETSPAAAELEEKVMNWLKQMLGLPENLFGVIQDTASTATLCAILTAREKFSDFKINESGFDKYENFRIYCSKEAHSSIEKAAKIAGFGSKNLVKIEVDGQCRLIPEILDQTIRDDLKNGLKPICIVAALGSTGTTAIDPLPEIAKICKTYNTWLHIDAAMAGSALILPEYRWMINGIEQADSFVFNPHKWLFTNFDCSAYFVKDKNALIKTFQVIPEYLKTKSDDHVNNYCDWGVPLGRRFRALKLWFVIRNFGIQGLQEKLRTHILLANELAKEIENEKDFELLEPVTINLVCFRYKPKNLNDENALNILNEELLHKINSTGKIYITHTKIHGKYSLRMVIAQTYVQQKHVKNAWELIKDIAVKSEV